MTREQCLSNINSCTQALNEFRTKKAQYESLSGPLTEAIASLSVAKGNISTAASQLGTYYTSKKATEKVGVLQEQCGKISTMISTIKSGIQEAIEKVKKMNYKIEEMNSRIEQYNAILPTLKE